MAGIANIGGLELGNGAQFWAYLSPHNDTAKKLLDWKVELVHVQGNWRGSITSENPQQQLETPKLSGLFNVKVTAHLAGAAPVEVTAELAPGSQRDIGCNTNCAAMIGIVASADGKSISYWTVWDAMCKRP